MFLTLKIQAEQRFRKFEKAKHNPVVFQIVTFSSPAHSHTSNFSTPHEDVSIQHLLTPFICFKDLFAHSQETLITLKEDIVTWQSSKITQGDRMTSRGLDFESWASCWDSGKLYDPVPGNKERGTQNFPSNSIAKGHMIWGESYTLRCTKKRYTTVLQTWC